MRGKIETHGNFILKENPNIQNQKLISLLRERKRIRVWIYYTKFNNLKIPINQNLRQKGKWKKSLREKMKSWKTKENYSISAPSLKDMNDEFRCMLRCEITEAKDLSTTTNKDLVDKWIMCGWEGIKKIF